MAIEVARRRFTVDEYYQMAETGILAPDDRVELIDGEIVQMSPATTPNAACVGRLNYRLSRAVPDSVEVRVQQPLRLDSFSEPEPDIALIRFREDFYAAHHPTPADVYLLIEVSHTSIRYDRRVKAHLYARFGVAELWVVDLNSDCIWTYRRPSPDGYRVVRRVKRGQRLAPQAFPNVELSVDEVLGPKSLD